MQSIDFTQVIRAVQKELPKEAFRPSGALVAVQFPINFLIIGAAYLVIRETDEPWIWVLATLVAGHSGFAMGNTGHTLAHRGVLRNRFWLYVLEFVSWSFPFAPATVWRLIHNAYHHKHTNARLDSQYGRRYTQSERTWFRYLYMLLIFPNRLLPGNPLVLLFQGLYVWLNVPHLLFGKSGGEGFERVSKRDKAFIVGEVLVLVLMQVGLYQLVEGHLVKYLLVGVAIPVLSCALATLYTHTEHSAIPVVETHNPLYGSQSIYLPRWLDWYHQYLSHHVEHHLFPGMHPRYYVAVRAVLERDFGADYQSATPLQVWRDAFRCDVLWPDPSASNEDHVVPAHAAQPVEAE